MLRAVAAFERRSPSSSHPHPISIQETSSGTLILADQVAVYPFAQQGIGISFPDASRGRHGIPRGEVLQALSRSIARSDHFRVAAVDMGAIEGVRADIRNGIIHIWQIFHTRGGITFHGCSESQREVLLYLHIADPESITSYRREIPATEDSRRALHRIAQSAIDALSESYAREASLSLNDLHCGRLAYSGALFSPDLLNDTLVLTLNPEVVSLEEEGWIGERLASEVHRAAREFNLQRVLLAFPSLEHLGATALGTLFDLNKNGQSDPSAPRVALCSLRDEVHHQLTLARAHLLLPIFHDPKTGASAPW